MEGYNKYQLNLIKLNKMRKPEDDYRTNLSKWLETKAGEAGLRYGATVNEFMAVLPKSSLLGVALPPEIEKFLACYAKANIAGGEELAKFTTNTTAHLPQSFFDKRLDPKREHPIVSDAVWLARTAVSRLGLTANGENNCSNLDELPLAA